MGRAQGAGPWAGPKEPTDAKTGTLRKAYATPLVLRNLSCATPCARPYARVPRLLLRYNIVKNFEKRVKGHCHFELHGTSPCCERRTLR